MAERRRPHRALRALLVLSTGSIVLAGVPAWRSVAAPDTVVRSVPIPATALARGRLEAAPDGTLRAPDRERTRAITTCAPIWFDGIAFTWAGRGRGPTIGVATGPWREHLGASVALGAEGGPDPGSAEAHRARRGSDYLWTGGARCARVRLSLASGSRIADLRAVFLNTSGTATGPGTGPPESGPSLAPSAPMPVAEAAAREPRIVTRARWGADPSLMNCTPTVAPFLTNAFVHHTAGSNAYARSQADDIVRGVYAYHTRVRGWCDIGYNFLVDRYGDVFEGRSGGVTANVVGAAQMGFNVGAFSVAAMGTFSVVAPPAATVRALERVLAWRLDVAHVKPLSRQTMTSGGGSTTRYARGTRVRLHAISGHRDTGLTDCPGGRLYDLLPRIRDVVAHTGLPKIYAPRLSDSPVVAGSTSVVRIRARGSKPLAWSVSVLDATGATVVDVPTTRGDTLDARWTAELPTPGSYLVVIGAADRDGAAARPAELPLVVEAPPGPTPSPTLTPTPSPTPSPTST